MVKKLIIISIIFAVTIAAGVWEIIYSTSVYKDIHDTLILAEKSAETHEEVYNEETIKLTDHAVEIWDKNKEILFCLGNHNVLRTVDEKLQSLKAMVHINYTDDAKVNFKISIGLIEAIQNDSVPNITNLF